MTMLVRQAPGVTLRAWFSASRGDRIGNKPPTGLQDASVNREVNSQYVGSWLARG